VNAHVLTEIVVATERLIATRERDTQTLVTGRKSAFIGPPRSGKGKKVKLTFFVGMDASDVALEVFTPGETFPAIGYDTDEGPSGSVGAVWTDGVWGRGDASSATLLGQVGNRNWTGLPAATFRPGEVP
jgi:hypothetical protein